MSILFKYKRKAGRLSKNKQHCKANQSFSIIENSLILQANLRTHQLFINIFIQLKMSDLDPA